MSIFATLAERSGAIGVVLGWWSELRANRRAMVGLLVIVGLVVGDGFFLLRDATARMRANYDRELVRLQRVAAVAQERDWPQRAAASAEIRATLEGRPWGAERAGIAPPAPAAW